jgi:hypothetical protein
MPQHIESTRCASATAPILSGHASARSSRTRTGKGFTIVLDALPIDGRLVLREIGERDDENAETADNESRSRKKRGS